MAVFGLEDEVRRQVVLAVELIATRDAVDLVTTDDPVNLMPATTPSRS